MPVADYTPTNAQVAALMRTRTKTRLTGEQGEFTADTRPTDDQVEEIIGAALQEVSTFIGDDIPEEVWTRAATLTSYKAAMLIELSYFPEQVKTDRSPYDAYERMYNKLLDATTEAVETAAGGEEPGASGTGGAAQGSFPEDEGGLVGWGSRW